MDKRDQKISSKTEKMIHAQNNYQEIVYRHLHEIVDDESFDVFFKNTYTNVRIDCYLFYPYLEKFFRYFEKIESIEFDFGNIKDDDLSHVFFKRMRVSGHLLKDLRVIKINSICLEEYCFDVFQTLIQLKNLEKISLTSVEINNRDIHSDFAAFFINIPNHFRKLFNLKLSIQSLTFNDQQGSICYLFDQFEKIEQLSIKDENHFIKKIKIHFNDQQLSRELKPNKEYKLIDADRLKELIDKNFILFIKSRRLFITHLQISKSIIINEVFALCVNLRFIAVLITGEEYDHQQGNLIERILNFQIDKLNNLESLSVGPKHSFNMLYKARTMNIDLTLNSKLIIEKSKEILQKYISKKEFYLSFIFPEVVIEVINQQNRLTTFFSNYKDDFLNLISDIINLRKQSWNQIYLSLGRTTQEVFYEGQIEHILNLSSQQSEENQTHVLIDTQHDLQQWLPKLRRLSQNVQIIFDFSTTMSLQFQNSNEKVQMLIQFVTCKCKLQLQPYPYLGQILEKLRNQYFAIMTMGPYVQLVMERFSLPESFNEKIIQKYFL